MFLAMVALVVALEALPVETAAGRHAVPPSLCRPEALSGFLRVGGCGVAAPRAVKRARIDLASIARPYPTRLVVLEVGVAADGSVVSVCVARGSRHDLDAAAAAAVWRWRFEPAKLDGRPMPAVIYLAFGVPPR